MFFPIWQLVIINHFEYNILWNVYDITDHQVLYKCKCILPLPPPPLFCVCVSVRARMIIILPSLLGIQYIPVFYLFTLLCLLVKKFACLVAWSYILVNIISRRSMCVVFIRKTKHLKQRISTCRVVQIVNTCSSSMIIDAYINAAVFNIVRYYFIKIWTENMVPSILNIRIMVKLFSYTTYTYMYLRISHTNSMQTFALVRKYVLLRHVPERTVALNLYKINVYLNLYEDNLSVYLKYTIHALWIWTTWKNEHYKRAGTHSLAHRSSNLLYRFICALKM